jgi:hypothetical protein
MIRVAVLVAALVLPALSWADQVWRWEDASGRLHYSNRPDRVPSYAEPLRGSIGVVRLPAVRATEAGEPRETYREPVGEPGPRRPRRGAHRFFGPTYCGALGYPYGLILNPTDPSELVKQAAALDRIGVDWRTGCCQ